MRCIRLHQAVTLWFVALQTYFFTFIMEPVVFLKLSVTYYVIGLLFPSNFGPYGLEGCKATDCLTELNGSTWVICTTWLR